MSAPKVLVTTSSFGAADPAPREALRDAGFDVHENPFKRKLTEAEVLSLLRSHKPIGLIAGLEPLTAGVLEGSASHLKAISRCGMGLDNVDLSAAERLGIKVFNTPDAPSQAVAELAVALMLSVLRRVAEADRNLRRGDWKSLQGRLLGARTVGVVGLGRIGRRVAALVGGFGAKVLGADQRSDLGPTPGVERVPFDKLIAESDIVTLHVPLTEETRRLIADRSLASMRPGAVLINTSRGGLIDEGALVEALKSGRLSGAGIDAFEREPYDGPLKGCPTAVLTCHMGSAAAECRARMESEAAENLIRALNGVIPPNGTGAPPRGVRRDSAPAAPNASTENEK